MAENLSAVPEPLLTAMTSAVGADLSATAAEALVEGAISLYAGVIAGTGGREDAIVLLAADALLTHAFQAQAQLDPAEMARLVDRLSGGAFLTELPAGEG